MPAKRKDARVLKKWIDSRGQWRVLSVLQDGRRSARHFGVEADADKLVAQLETRLARAHDTTAERAIVLYRPHLLKKGNKPESVDDTLYRLRLFFGPVLKVRVSSLTEDRCKELYAGKWDGDRLLEHGLVTRPTSKQKDAEGRPIGPPLAVDSQRNILAECKTFARWWAAQGWVGASPLESVQGEGKRNHGGLGKTVLRRKEIRAFFRYALAQARGGDERAVAALLALLLGMRATEIVTRLVRDLDDEEWVLGVDADHAKTTASERGIDVPAILRPMLARLIKGKQPDDYIFGDGTHPHWRDWVRKSIRALCIGAKVPLETAHGMRGAQSDLAREAGATGELVARQLGHESETTGERSYTAKRAVAGSKHRRVLKVLAGGLSDA